MSEIYKEESRKPWHRIGNLEPGDLELGCLQRIADATELMAREHQNLVNRAKWAEERNARLVAENKRLANSNAALRGHLRRMKRKVSNA